MNTTNRTNIIARKGINTLRLWASDHSVALDIASGYTDRGHDVTVVCPPDYPDMEITAAAVDSMLGLNT